MANKKPEYATPRRIMGEAVDRLKGYHKEIYLAMIRDGKSLKETAVLAEMDEGHVQKALDEAIEFVSKYCKRAIAKGRI